MKILLKELGKYGKEAVFAPFFKFLEAAIELVVPFFVSDIIDRGVNGGDKNAVVADLAIMLGLAAVGLVFSVLGQFCSARAAVGFSANVRRKVYVKLMDSPPSVTDKIGVSAMITRMTSDVNQMQTGVNLFLRLLLRSPFVVIGAFVAAAIIDLKVSLVFLVLIAALGAVVAIIMAITLPKYSEAQRKLDDVSLSARENLTGARVIRAFGAEDDEIREYRKKTGALEKFKNRTGMISAFLNPCTFVLVNLAIVALLYFGGVRVNAGVISQGQTVALYDYMSQILIELVKFANLVVTVSKSVACARRVEKVLEEDGSYIKTESGKISDAYVEFKGVSMRYADGGESLTDINLTIEKGQTVGIVGGTGSGKTTLVSLIPRFYDAYKGFVAVGGKDVRSYDVKELRAKIGFVLQKSALFTGTIDGNLRLGNEGLSEEVEREALDAAQATDVVRSKGGDLSAEVRQGGKNFSGGQKQRLAIARALARKPEILILDDSSSALDFATDLKLRRAIKRLDYKPTVIIVSQRTSAVADADKIIVLDEGKVVGVGTDESLTENCDVYREIKRSQQRGAAK